MQPEPAPSDEYSLYRTCLSVVSGTSTHSAVEPYLCTLRIDNVPTALEIDIGAAATLIRYSEFRRLSFKLELVLETEKLPKVRT